MSLNDGITATPITANLPAQPVNGLQAAGGPTALLAGLPSGIWRRTDFSGSGTWAQVATGDFRDFEADGTTLYAARADGTSVKSTDNGQNWSPLGATLGDSTALSVSNLTGPTVGAPAKKKAGKAPAIANTANLWSASNATGAF